ncbi:MAG: hypothetical protein FWF88_06315 [Peptococcaceae bacterium]|nr:hypothetical protein [Peptococcaceae bacterium]
MGIGAEKERKAALFCALCVDAIELRRQEQGLADAPHAQPCAHRPLLPLPLGSDL